MVTNSANALENASETAVQGDRLVPWSTSDGWGQAEMVSGVGSYHLQETLRHTWKSSHKLAQ
jgi:hypothetical protein